MIEERQVVEQPTAGGGARPLRVVHVLTSRAITGGADHHTLLLCRDLEQMGHTIELVTQPGAIVEEIRDTYGWSVHVLASQPKARSVLPLARALGRIGPDVVHTHKPVGDVVGLGAARLARVPAILATVHVRLNTEKKLDHFRPLWLPGRRVRSALLRRVPHRIVAVSEATRSNLIEQLRIEENRVVTVLNGTDPERFRKRSGAPIAVLRTELGGAPEGPLVGMIARFREVKGHMLLLDAIPRVIEAMPKVHFAFIGKNPGKHEHYAGRVLEKVRELGVSDYVSFHEHRTDIPEVLNALDLFVLPSSVEGLSRAMLEALASELPVVATDVDGHREVLRDGLNARLVPPGQPESLAEALIELLRDGDLCRRLGQEGRRTVLENFTSMRASQRQSALYQEILAERASG